MPRGKHKEQILNAGLALMYRKGFSASGVQEIADASGVPKGSFYNYFRSKEDFAVQAVQRYTEDMSAYLSNALERGSGSPLRRLKRLFKQWAGAGSDERDACGCFSGNLSQEMANRNAAVRTALRKSFERLEGHYVRCLEEAQNRGEIGADLDVHRIGGFIYNGWQGALVRAKATGNARPLHEFREIVFEQLLGRG